MILESKEGNSSLGNTLTWLRFALPNMITSIGSEFLILYKFQQTESSKFLA